MNLRANRPGWLGWLTIAAASFAILSVCPAAAHPHVWMTVTVSPKFDEAGRFLSVREKWYFDYDYSSIVGSQLDQNSDGVFSVEELIATISPGGLLGWIGEKDWLTTLTVAGQKVANGPVTDISVGVADGRLVVAFTVALQEPQPAKLGAEIDVFDREVYYDVQFDNPDIEAPTAPASCRVAPRPKDDLDPVAVMIIKKLGLKADAAAINDPATGFSVRVTVNCT